MDFIKKQWKTIVRYQFWILSFLVLIGTVLVFFLSSSGLKALIAARSSKLKAASDQIKTISGATSTHPNVYSHKHMDDAVAALEIDIKRAWALQYQSQEKLMKWPMAAFSNPKIHGIFESNRPVEQFIDFPIQQPLPAPFNQITLVDKNTYKQYIGPEFEKVSEIIGTKWSAKLSSASAGSTYGSDMGMSGGSSEGGYGGGSGYGGYGSTSTTGSNNQTPDVVRWSTASQQTLLGQMAPWYAKIQAPSILDIYYTQEDMWLLTGIMEIIRLANGDAKENFQTVVHEVEWIRMGKHASRNAGVLTGLPSAGGASGYGGMGMGGMGMDGSDGGMASGPSEGGIDYGAGSGGGKMGGMSGEGDSGSGDPVAGIDPADGRYISFAAESQFEPRKGEELRAAIREISHTNAVDAVVKRVPIRMRLKVDPSRYNQLIVACGSSKLRLEVYQVRYGTEAAPDSGSGGMGGYGGGMGGDGYGGGSSGGGGKMSAPGGEMSGGIGGMGGGISGEGGDGYGGYGSATSSLPDAESEVAIEIYGLIYLYNPVNIKSLGADSIAEKQDVPPAANNASAPPILSAPAASAPAQPAVPAAQPATPNTPAAEAPVLPGSETAVPSQTEKPTVTD